MKSGVCGLAVLLVIACTVPCKAAEGDHAQLAARAQAILKTHCSRCHSADGSAKGGFNYVLDRDKLLARKKIVPEKPAASEIYVRMRDGEMPPRDQKLRPGAEALAVLEQWIAAGAPGETAPSRTFISESELQRLVLADLEAVEPRQRRFVRYFTLTHLANAGFSDDSLQTTRRALAKLLNSLSWHPRLVLPWAVDPGKTIVRIDLRDLKWNARLWDRLVAFYPYRLPASESTAKSFAVATGTELPLLRADWFLATASRPPLYHDLLQLPGADRQLERLLQVDVLANIQDDNVARAGFTDSGVSKNNRMIERHDAAHGAYWRSYDFADNLERQNLFNHPLGPAPTAQNSFVHAGGELIFHLPNGLQGYLLIDANGRRLDQAPVEIVSDPKRPDRKVENGLSCMSCHVRGLIPKADQVRAHVQKNPRAFSRADAETAKALYPPAARMLALIQEDNQRFEKALAGIGIKPDQDEPITVAVLRYEGGVDLPGAAAEMGLTETEFATRLERSASLTRVVGPLRVKGGSVPRETFQAAFVELARELRPGEAPGTPSVGLSTTIPFAGHQGSILSIAFAPDGRRAVSGSDDKTLRLWDVSSGRELRRFDGHAEPVAAVAFSADGKQVASAGGDRTVRVWDTATGALRHRFTGHADSVNVVAFSPTERLVLSGGQDGSIRLWDLASNREALALAGHTGCVASAAFSADGRWIISGSHDRTVRVWETASGKEVRRLQGHAREVLAVAISADGRRALSGGNDKSVRLWNLESGAELRRFEGHANAVVQVAFAASGRQVVSASSQYQSADKTLRVWDADSGRELASFGGADADRISCVAFAPDGQSALSGSSEPVLRFWKLSK